MGFCFGRAVGVVKGNYLKVNIERLALGFILQCAAYEGTFRLLISKQACQKYFL